MVLFVVFFMFVVVGFMLFFVVKFFFMAFSLMAFGCLAVCALTGDGCTLFFLAFLGFWVSDGDLGCWLSLS
jgi:hypothetical protein